MKISEFYKKKRPTISFEFFPPKTEAGEIKLFVLTGRFTGDTRSPSDILLVGNLKEKTVDNLIKKYEKKFNFSIRYTIMTEKEFFERRQMMDKFIFSIFEADNIKVVDKLGV